MKKLLIINILLMIIVIKVPLKIDIIENTKEEIKEKTEEIKQEIVEAKPKETKPVITSRGQEEQRKPIKKLDINVNTDLRTVSNLTAEEYNKMLKGTNLYGIGKDLEESEKINGINGLYLMGLACLESSYGNSNFAKQRNNLVGWNAVDSNPNKATYFKSKGECIRFVANKLKNNYLTQGAIYFEGYTATAVDKHYCTDKKHAQKIINIINKLERKL